MRMSCSPLSPLGLGQPGPSVLALVQDIATAILRPGLVVGALGAWLLLAQDDRLNLVLARAQQQQHALHAVRAALPQADVVLAAAALVGVALDQHLALGMLA